MLVAGRVYYSTVIHCCAGCAVKLPGQTSGENAVQKNRLVEPLKTSTAYCLWWLFIDPMRRQQAYASHHDSEFLGFARAINLWHFVRGDVNGEKVSAGDSVKKPDTILVPR